MSVILKQLSCRPAYNTFQSMIIFSIYIYERKMLGTHQKNHDWFKTEWDSSASDLCK
jgi:hypothetical protein